MIREFNCPLCGFVYEANSENISDLFDHNVCPECDYYFVPSRPKGDPRPHWSPVENMLRDIKNLKD